MTEPTQHEVTLTEIEASLLAMAQEGHERVVAQHEGMVRQLEEQAHQVRTSLAHARASYEAKRRKWLAEIGLRAGVTIPEGAHVVLGEGARVTWRSSESCAGPSEGA